MRQHYAAFFVQDDWRAGDSLSINYGLRYEFVTDPKELNGQVAGLLSFADLESGPGGVTPGTPMFKNPSKKSFAPRLGVAWNPLGNKKQTVKGGYGVFYQPLTTSFYRGTTFRIYPYFAGVDIRQPTVFGPGNIAVLAAGVNPATVQKRSEFIDYDIEQPFSQQWHVNFERDLGHNLVDRSRLHRIARSQPAVLRRSQRGPVRVRRRRRQAARPRRGAALPELGPHPHAHQRRALELSRHDARRQQALFRRLAVPGVVHARQCRTTRGRAARSAAATSTTAPAARPTGTIRRTSTDRRTSTSVTTSCSTPSTSCRSDEPRPALPACSRKGWNIGGVLQASSGLPFTPLLSYDQVGDLQSDTGLQKPNVNGDGELSADSATVVRPGRSSAFRRPACSATPRRNSLRGPGLKVADLSVFKNFAIGRYVAQFRIEAFNAFNWVNLGLPDATIFNAGGVRNPTAGEINRTSTAARQIQLGVKFMF